MWKEKKRALKERIITTLKAEKMNAVCLKSGNCPSPQLSFIAAHRHVATLATEPNKPLDRISFLISQTLLGSTLPRSWGQSPGHFTYRCHYILYCRSGIIVDIHPSTCYNGFVQVDHDWSF